MTVAIARLQQTRSCTHDWFWHSTAVCLLPYTGLRQHGKRLGTWSLQQAGHVAALLGACWRCMPPDQAGQASVIPTNTRGHAQPVTYLQLLSQFVLVICVSHSSILLPSRLSPTLPETFIVVLNVQVTLDVIEMPFCAWL
jgi:hypothetical protein